MLGFEEAQKKIAVAHAIIHEGLESQWQTFAIIKPQLATDYFKNLIFTAISNPASIDQWTQEQKESFGIFFLTLPEISGVALLFETLYSTIQQANKEWSDSLALFFIQSNVYSSAANDPDMKCFLKKMYIDYAKSPSISIAELRIELHQRRTENINSDEDELLAECLNHLVLPYHPTYDGG